MTVPITKPALNLREELAALRAKVAAGVAQEAFWLSGDGATTTFALPRGWKPKFAYVDGALNGRARARITPSRSTASSIRWFSLWRRPRWTSA